MEYIEIRCRGDHRIPPLECRALIGGPSIDTLLSYDFSKKPYVDVRFCQECRRWVRITIKDLRSIPEMEILEKGTKVKFTKFTEIFPFLKVLKHG